MHSNTHPDPSPDEAINAAEAICEEQNLRFTKLRRTILRMIWANWGPAKAYDILDQLKEQGIGAKPPTVYRTLDFLMEHGLIHKLNSQNAYVGCSHPQQHSACYFLICNQCGDIQECCHGGLKQAIADTVEHEQFSPNRITLEIEGTCARCVSQH